MADHERPPIAPSVTHTFVGRVRELKGVIFTEFLDFVEVQFGTTLAAGVLAAAEVPPGHYRTLGSYDHRELVRMIEFLSTAKGVPSKELTRRFGAHVFQR